MKKMVISVDDANRQFAFVKGNRPTNSKVVKAKERSIKAYGQLSPVTVVNGAMEQSVASKIQLYRR